MQRTNDAVHQRNIAHHRCITSYMQLTKDASQHKCITPKMKRTRNAAYLRITIPKMHPIKDIMH